MFKLELDFILTFVPLMDDDAEGIRITRSFELPFAPTTGLHLTGSSFADFPDPEGSTLQDVVWDMDRSVFSGHATLAHVDLPIAWIPAELRSWLDRGWQLGSFADSYESNDGCVTTALTQKRTLRSAQPAQGDDEDRWPGLPTRSRPSWFNLLLRVLVAEMAGNFNNLAVAFAVDKTKLFFRDNDITNGELEGRTRFRSARDLFDTMSTRQKMKWRDEVLRKTPRLGEVMS